MTDDPTLSARLRSRQQEIAASSEEDRTLADRLTQRALDQRITIDLGDEAGPIPVEIRVPTFAELDRLGIIRATLASNTVETVPEYAALMAEMCEIVGGLCTDPALGPDFWQAGLFPTDAIAIISEAAQEAAKERVEQARRFRQQAGGKRTGAARASVRKDTG